MTSSPQTPPAPYTVCQDSDNNYLRGPGVNVDSASEGMSLEWLNEYCANLNTAYRAGLDAAQEGA